jgi:hypothetical protein
MTTSEPETPVNDGGGSAAVAGTEARKTFDRSNAGLVTCDNTGLVKKRFGRVRTSTPTPMKNAVDVQEFFRTLKPAIRSRFDESFEPAKQQLCPAHLIHPTHPSSAVHHSAQLLDPSTSVLGGSSQNHSFTSVLGCYTQKPSSTTTTHRPTHLPTYQSLVVKFCYQHVTDISKKKWQWQCQPVPPPKLDQALADLPDEHVLAPVRW